MMATDESGRTPPQPAIWQWTLGFVLVGMAWGLTTPFMRRAALKKPPSHHASLQNPNLSRPRRLILKAFFAVFDVLRRPAYAIPFLINITGSLWFFLLIGKAELSLSLPITSGLSFVFTVIGEWLAEGKGVGRETWIGMALVLGGIALCIHSKT